MKIRLYQLELGIYSDKMPLNQMQKWNDLLIKSFSRDISKSS